MSCMLMVTGCGAYLHNPGRATATADLQAKFGDLSTPAYFEAQQRNLADFAQREDKALADLLVTSRNYRLLNIVKPATTVSDPGRSAARRLVSLVGDDLETAYGQRVLTPQQAKALMTSRFTKDLAVRTTAFNTRRVATTARSYKAAGGQLTVDCASVLASVAPGTSPISHGDEARAARYGKLVDACQRLSQRNLLVDDCNPASDSGNLATICAAIVELAQDKASEDRKKQLERAEKALMETLKAANQEDEDKGLKEAIDFLDSVGELPTDDKLLKILTKIDSVFGSELEASLAGFAEQTRAELPRATAPLIAALELLGAVRELEGQASIAPLDRPSALLIGLAKVRHDLKIVSIDLNEEKQQDALLLNQASLLRGQLYYLAQAQQSLCGKAAACRQVETGTKAPDAQSLNEALSYYVRSQNTGAIPFEIVRFREIQVQRASALERARASEADYRALLKPAIEQLAAYGAGGIKPKTLADFFAGLPVAGSILVK